MEAGLQDVLLSVELPADVILAGADETVSLPADTVDRVYAVTTEDQAEALSAAAEAAGTVFVPELSEPPAKSRIICCFHEHPPEPVSGGLFLQSENDSGNVNIHTDIPCGQQNEQKQGKKDSINLKLSSLMGKPSK